MNYSFLKGTLQPTHDLLGNVSGFITLLVRAAHRNQEVTGWNPVEALSFSGLTFPLCNCKKIESITARIIAYMTSDPRFNMVQFIYNFIFELNYIMGWHWKQFWQYGVNQLADSFDSFRVLCNGPILRMHWVCISAPGPGCWNNVYHFTSENLHIRICSNALHGNKTKENKEKL